MGNVGEFEAKSAGLLDRPKREIVDSHEQKGEKVWGRKTRNSEFSLGHVEFQLMRDHPSKTVRQAVGDSLLEWRAKAEHLLK